MEVNGLILIEENKLVELLKIAVETALKEFSKQEPPKQDDLLLTRKAAAVLLDVTPNTLTRYVRDGRLKAGLINGKYRFRKGDVMNCMFKGK